MSNCVSRKVIAAVAIALCMLVVGQTPCGAQPPESPAGSTQKSPQQAALEKEIHAAAKTFVEAFNQGDAKALAAKWTPDGEYVTEDGGRFVGREVIEKEYAEFFKQNPGVKMRLAIDSIRRVSDEVAVEDGRAEVGPTAAGTSATNRYMVIHSKREGKWLLSSVRDARLPSPARTEHLEDLEWLVGTWHVEQGETDVRMTCRWLGKHAFLLRSFTASRGGQVVKTGVQLIGWEPIGRHVTSWLFDSDGGHSVGIWVPRENGWTIRSAGVLLDGTPTSATNSFARIDEDTLSWKSEDRTAGAVALPDTTEIVMKREK